MTECVCMLGCMFVCMPEYVMTVCSIKFSL